MIRSLAIILPGVLMVMGYQYYTAPTSEKGLQLLVSLFVLSFLLIAMYVMVSKIMASYMLLKIIVSDNGIEVKVVTGSRFLPWNNLAVKQKAGGSIILWDTTVSAFDRMMKGTGKIMIPYGILDREKLLADILAYTGSGRS